VNISVHELKPAIHELIYNLLGFSLLICIKSKLMKNLLLLTTFSLCIFSAKSQVTTDLVSRWNFTNGNLRDVQGNNDAIASGAVPTTDRFGNANMAYFFDGINDHMYIGSPSNLNLDIMDQITISFWARPDATTGGLRAMVAKWAGASNEQYGVFQNTTQTTVAIRTTNNSGVNVNTAFTSGEWKHIVFSYDKTNSNNHKVYINGALILNQNFAIPYANTSSSTSLSLGCQLNDLNGTPGTPDRFFEGALDDISIYSRVLTQSEVDSLFDAEANQCSGFAVDVIATNHATNNDGSIVFNVLGGLAPYHYSVNGSTVIQMNSSSVCAYSFEGGTSSFTAAAGTVFTGVHFASYGASQGTCTDLLYGNCHADNSQSITEDSLIGRNSGSINTHNGIFGDPCFGTGKFYRARVSYAEAITLNALAPGMYEISITDSLGCSASTTIVINSTNGLTEYHKSSFVIFPNPSSDEIRISGPSYNSAECNIYSADGRMVYSGIVTPDKAISVAAFVSGVYIVQINDNNNIYFSRLIRQ